MGQFSEKAEFDLGFQGVPKDGVKKTKLLSAQQTSNR